MSFIELSEEYRTEIFTLASWEVICSIPIGLDGQNGLEPGGSRDNITQWEGYKMTG